MFPLPSHRRRRRRGLTLRVLALLAVTLFAVVPHATLAASFAHGPASPAAASPHHGARGHDKPCHDDSSRQAAAHALSCCAQGCGVLAETASTAMPPEPVQHWQVRRERHPADAGLSIEPGERPPRAGALDRDAAILSIGRLANARCEARRAQFQDVSI